MNEPDQIKTEINQENPFRDVPPVKPSIFSKISDKIPQKVKDLFNKFYANKKIFWPITILFGIIILIIILGLLFGTPKTPTPPGSKKTPQPLETTPEASPSGDVLSTSDRLLKELNNQINSLDLGQNKLKPPVINYKVDF